MTTKQRALLHWARHHLGVSAEATAAEIGAAFLRKVGRDPFMPVPQTVYALRLLQKQGDSAGSDQGRQQAILQVEASLRAEVDAFARQSYEGRDAERQAHWAALNARCDWVPSLAERMHRLRTRPPGITAAGVSDYPANLANLLGELNSLSIGQRSRRRQDLMRAVARDRDGWEAAALALQHTSPQAAELDPVFFRTLFQRGEREKPVREVERTRSLPDQMRRNRFAGALVLFVVVGLFTHNAWRGSGHIPQREPPVPKPVRKPIDPEPFREKPVPADLPANPNGAAPVVPGGAGEVERAIMNVQRDPAALERLMKIPPGRKFAGMKDGMPLLRDWPDDPRLKELRVPK